MAWKRLKLPNIRRIFSAPQEMQNTITITTNTGDDSTTTNTGNSYKTYGEQVKALSQKSKYQANWGNQFVSPIAVLRSFFMLGSGFKPEIREGHENDDKAMKTLEFTEEFLLFNDLDGSTVQLWGQETEIEGKIAAVLSPDTSGDRETRWLRKRSNGSLNPQIRARHLSWLDHGYEVDTEEDDYTRYTTLSYQKGDGSPEVYPESKFAYARFGGRMSEPNISPPVMASVLNGIENLDKALTDWRKIDFLYGAATPHLNFGTSEGAKNAKEELISRSWRIGKLLITADGEFKYVGPPEHGLNSIKEEIIMWAKIVSGATGIPVQFLGFSDLLSNRSTADNLLEQIVAAVNGDREIWKTFFEQLINKAIKMANAELGADLASDVITVNIVEISSLLLHRLTQVYLPLKLGGIITAESVLEKVPGINKEAELERLEAEREKEQKEMFGSTGLNPPAASNESPNGGRNF